MKVAIDNLKDLLATYVKPLVSFIGVNAITEPIIKLEADKKDLILSSATHDKSITLITNGQIKESGVLYINASSLSTLRSSHKQAILSNSGSKLTIKSQDKSRKLVLSIDTVDENSYPITRGLKDGKKASNKVSLSGLNKVVDKLNMVPILVPGQSKAIISIRPKEKGFRAIVHDDHRVLALESKSDIGIEEELITDFKEFQAMVKLISSLSDKAFFSFSKKAIIASGFEKDDTRVLDLHLNYSLPGTEYLDRAFSIYKMSVTDKPVMSFPITKEFSEIMENVIGITNTKASSTTMSYMDITLRNNLVTIAGTGQSTTYNESLKVASASGRGTVRLGTNTIADLVRSFSDKALFRVNSKSILIINKWEGYSVFFILPFLNYSETNK